MPMPMRSNAGMRVGDIIVSVNGAPTPTFGALSAVLAGLKPRQKARVVVVEQTGTRSTLQVTLGTYPGS